MTERQRQRDRRNIKLQSIAKVKGQGSRDKAKFIKSKFKAPVSDTSTCLCLKSIFMHIAYA